MNPIYFFLHYCKKSYLVAYFFKLKKFIVMKHILIFLLAFFPLFLFSQEKGIGLNLNLYPKYEIGTKTNGSKYDKFKGFYPRPVLYAYKMYKHGTRIKELVVMATYRKFTTDGYAFTKYDTLTKQWLGESYKQMNRGFGIGIDYTKFYRLASFSQNKLNFWLGVRTRLETFFTSTESSSSTLGYATLRREVKVSLGIVPTVTYKVNNKLTLDARWNQPSNVAVGWSYFRQKNVQVPFNQSRITPIVDWTLILWSPSFQIGAKYALNSFSEPPIVPKPPSKPTNTYYGIGLNINIKNNNIYNYRRYYEFDYDNDALRFKPVFSAFRISKGERIYQEFAIGELEFVKKNISVADYEYDKNTNTQTRTLFGAKQSEKTFAFNYTFFHKIQKLSYRSMNVYWGANLKYFNTYIEAAPLTEKGYFQSQGFSGIRIATASSILWRINKKTYLETRFLPNFYFDYGKKSSQNDNPKIKENTTYQEQNYNYDFNSAFQFGVKYILKTEKPKKIKYKPAINKEKINR
jgi:hypothetical protein